MRAERTVEDAQLATGATAPVKIRMQKTITVLACFIIARSIPAVGAAHAPARPEVGVIDHVADGDTFTLRNGIRVRLVGIDAPEEYFGKHDCGSKPAALPS